MTLTFEKYRVATLRERADDGKPKWSGKLEESSLRAALDRRLDPEDGNARWRERGDEDGFGPWKPQPRILDAACGFLYSAPFGVLVTIDTRRGPSLLVRKIAEELRLIPTIGNSKVDLFHSYVAEEWPTIESWGICNRRFIAGTSIWSQHCPWPPPDSGANAEDYHAAFAVMKACSRDLADKAATLRIGQVLFDNAAWNPTQGWHYAAVGHTDHIHVEGPKRTGSPRSGCP